MISIIVPVRNSREFTKSCLQSLSFVFSQSDLEVEYLLIDDNSDESYGIIDLFLDFRKTVDSDVRISRFKKHQQYTVCFSWGLSHSKGNHVFFVSNDMIVTPYFVRNLLDVAGKDDKIGIVRGTSQYTDSHLEHTCAPPCPIRNYQDILDFSDYISKYYGSFYVEDERLTGDAILIKTKLINAIGVMDIRFFGYFGDIDYGLRARRAGFKLVCAKGAWLYHEGAGSLKQDSIDKQIDLKTLHKSRMQEVQQAYTKFREKWDTTLPEQYPGVKAIDFSRLIDKVNVGFNEYEEPVNSNMVECELF